MRGRSVLIVGAGLTGATIARQLAEAGIAVTVIDRRDHVAGNAYDEMTPEGIRIHRYGPHIFHTANRPVIDFLGRFTGWLPYLHRVHARLADGREVVMPPNDETRRVVGAENLFAVLYRPYTRKMWGCPPEALDPAVLGRVPIRPDGRAGYFPYDQFQAMPDRGYAAMVGAMLDHPRITLQLATAFDPELERGMDHVFNAMSIDDYFGQDLGPLPYRSLRFHHESHQVDRTQSVPVVNFTDDGPFTRITEWKQFPGHGNPPGVTILTREEPCAECDNPGERYYPIRDRAGANRQLYEAYRARVPPHVSFVGRCGLYAYLDMDQAVSSALATARRYVASLAHSQTRRAINH